MFEYSYSRCCSVFELFAVVISSGFYTVAANSACQRLSILESPASDLTDRVLEYLSSRCCSIFELVAIVISLGFPPVAATLDC